MPMELHTQHDLMLPVRARPLKNVAQMVEQRIVSSLLSWLPVKFNADNAGFYYQAISGNHNNQRHQRAIENAEKSAEIITISGISVLLKMLENQRKS